jgi:hypothetical protein
MSSGSRCPAKHGQFFAQVFGANHEKAIKSHAHPQIQTGIGRNIGGFAGNQRLNA